jgi:hypothetical protein
MRGKVRVCRLKLATTTSSKFPLGQYPDDLDLERFLELEQLHRFNECLVASASRTGPHIHGIEDFHGGRFWALGSTSDSESEVDEHIVLPGDCETPGLPMSHSSDRLPPLVPEPTSGSYSDMGLPLGSHTVDSGTKRRSVQRPWKGRLPAPRIYPRLSLGDTIGRALISSPVARS